MAPSTLYGSRPQECGCGADLAGVATVAFNGGGGRSVVAGCLVMGNQEGKKVCDMIGAAAVGYALNELERTGRGRPSRKEGNASAFTNGKEVASNLMVQLGLQPRLMCRLRSCGPSPGQQLFNGPCRAAHRA